VTLKEARLRRGLTQDELAALSGVSQAVISKLETSEGPSPSWDTVGSLCLALKVNPYKVFPVHLPEKQAVAS
jgi:transcriptional regulator with XRE-family HTH domain